MTKSTCFKKANHFHDKAYRNLSRVLYKPRLAPHSFQFNNKMSLQHQSELTGSRSSSSLAVAVGPIKRQQELKQQEGKVRKHIGIFKTKLTSRIHNNKQSFAFLLLVSSLLFVLSTCVNESYALNCFHCSSADNQACDESFAAKDNFTSNTDCEKLIGKPAKVCRKIVQYIENKKVVIRSCGFIDEHEEKDRKSMCYKRSGTFALMMESCVCYEDLCNHSTSLVPSYSVLILAFGFSILAANKLLARLR